MKFALEASPKLVELDHGEVEYRLQLAGKIESVY